MCNRARYLGEPETLIERFGAKWLADRPMDNRFHPQELVPFGRAWVIRENDRGRGVDVMSWDVLGGQAKTPARGGTVPRPLAMTNVRNLSWPQWRHLAEKPENRCLIPLTEFCEWSREKDPEKGIKGEMWFATTDQPVFAVAGFWQAIGDKAGFAMVTCDANELVKPIHPKAMITILAESDWDRWLTGSYEDVVGLQQPYPADQMTVRGARLPDEEGEMIEQEIADATALRDMVARVMGAVSTAPGDAMGGSAIDAQKILQAFQFITAAMIEAAPGTKTPKQLREAAEAQAVQILTFAKRFRADFERTGEHPWNRLNIPPETMQ